MVITERQLFRDFTYFVRELYKLAESLEEQTETNSQDRKVPQSREVASCTDLIPTLSRLSKGLSDRVIRSRYKAQENTVDLEHQKLQDCFDSCDETIERLIDENCTSSIDVKEIILFHYGFLMDLKIADENALKELANKTNSVSAINYEYNRILELNLKAQLNYKLLKKQLKVESAKDVCDELSDQSPAEIKDWIVDSIYCLTSISKSLNIIGTSYLYNHIWQAYTYERLAQWCEWWTRIEEDKEQDRILKRKIGEIEKRDLSTKTYREKALQHFYAAQEMHSEGAAYREILDKMYYLDDNFNDNLFHYCAAIERFRINNGIVAKKIKALEDSLEGSYSVDGYVKIPA